MTAPPTRRLALVNGAARNIGRATAIQLAGQGFDVVVHTRQDEAAAAEVAAAVEALGVRGRVVLADLTDAEAVTRMAEEVGPVDVLVNNAASRPHRPFLDVDLAEWRSVFAITVEAPYLLCHALLPGMRERGWGRIVNTTGVRAMQGAAERATSSSAKHALLRVPPARPPRSGHRGRAGNGRHPGRRAEGGVRVHGQGGQRRTAVRAARAARVHVVAHDRGRPPGFLNVLSDDPRPQERPTSWAVAGPCPTTASSSTPVDP